MKTLALLLLLPIFSHAGETYVQQIVQDVNTAEIANTPTSVSTGNADAGTQRVVLASDQPPIAVSFGGLSTTTTNVAQWGGVDTTLGQKTSTASVPVVLASDQSAIPVTGPLTNAEMRASSVPVTAYQGGSWTTTTTVTNFPSNQVVSGTVAVTQATSPWVVNTATSVAVSNFPSVQSVTGTVTALQGTTPFQVNATTGDPVNVYIDAGQSDAFGRIRVGQPVQLFESQLQYALGALVWNSSMSATGASITHLSTAAAAELQVGGASGAFAIRQSREYMRYQSGKSQLIYLTAVVGPATANVTKEWGYGDRYNGVFFRQTGSGLFVVIRSTAGGVFTERAVAQTSFNVDPINGSGPSKFNVDLSSGNTYWIDFGWLGYGEVRFGVLADGRNITAHIFKNSNSFGVVWMNTPNLPIHYAIRNTGASTGAKLLQTCSSVMGEGNTESFGVEFSTATGSVETVVNTRRPILTIRPSNTYRGLENRQRFQIDNIDITVTNAQSLFYEIVQDGVLTGTNYAAVASESGMEADKSATAITGGIVIESGYINSVGTRQATAELRSRSPLTVDFDSKNGTPLSIVLTSFGGNANTAGAFKWSEFR